MKAIYREVLADLDDRIARLQGTRSSIAQIADANDNDVIERRVMPRRGRGPSRKGRAKVGAGDQVVFDVIRDGAHTLPTIITAAKVKPSAARAAVRRLRKAGRVRMNGNKRSATYEVKGR